MRRATLTAAAAVFAAIATAAPAPVANQLWVTNKINEVTGTNTAAKIAAATNATLAAANAYTDAAIQGAGSITPQVVTNIVEGVVTNDIGGGAWVTNITATSSGKPVTLLNVAWGNADYPNQWIMELRVPGIGDAWRLCESPNNTDPNAKTLAASEYPELVTTRGMNALGLAYWADTTNAIANATPDLSSRTTFDDATNAAAAVVIRDVPAWARSATQPESMTDNAAVLTNSLLKTRSGTVLTLDNVSGAASYIRGTTVTSAEGAGMLLDQYSGSYDVLSFNSSSNRYEHHFHQNANIRVIPPVLQIDNYDYLAYVSDLTNNSYITTTQAAAAYYPKSQGDAWSTYWDGDDVRVTVTNYDSAANIPSLYLEQRTNETAQATNAFKTVWREMAHWEKFLGTNWNWSATWSGFQTWKTTIATELEEKADKAWGYYDSHTGNYSPDGYTVVSSSNIMIAANMSYQKTVTTSAEVWVLTANEPYEPTGVSTNGGFQIRDGDGNIQFEIVKGDKVTVAAQANAVTVDQTTTPNTLVVTFNIVAGTHPTAEVCLDLSSANWKAETADDCPATVTWSGSSGAYVARIQPNAATTKCFCKATYQRGGDTYINNRCAVGMSQLVLGGVTYNLGTATIDGNTVLTLTPAN